MSEFSLLTFLVDLKQAFRLLLRAPGFSVAVLLTLTLGIGANASVFTLLDQVMWRPLPFIHPESLVIPYETNLGHQMGQFSGPNFQDFRRETRSFAGMAGFMSSRLNLSGDGKPEVLSAARVSANFFTVLGVQPVIGRGFITQEETDGAHRVVVLGYEFWQRRFGGDSNILNQSLRLDGVAWQVVGILPKGFRFPYRLGLNDVYFPMAFTPAEQTSRSRGNHFFSAVARLQPSVSHESASQDMARVMSGIAKANPDFVGRSAGVRPLKQAAMGDKRQHAMLLLVVVAGLVLLIACVNVANLLLARSLTRRQELAIRTSMGAGRLRMICQLLTESLLLSMAGGLLGLLLSIWISQGILLVVDLPTGVTSGLSLRTVAVMSGLSVLTSLLCGGLPAWQATRGDLVPALREGSKGSSSTGTHRLRSILVIGEIALATSLLVVTGLVLRNLWQMQALPLGFEPKGLITGNLNPPEATHGNDAKIRTFTEALAHRLNETSGVASAAITDSMPFGSSSSDSNYSVEGEAPLTPGQTQQTFVHHITPGFLSTLRMRLFEGRDFTWSEGPTTCLVSQSFARMHFQSRSPIGKRVRIGGGPWLDIVGLVASTEQWTPGQTVLPHLYRPLHGFTGYAPLQVVARATGDPRTLKNVLPSAAVALDPDLPMTRASLVEDLVADSMKSERSQCILMLVFAIVALVLALIGVYGLMTFVARSRAGEWGIRSALGASRRDLLTLIMGQGLRLVLSGLVVGLLGAGTLSRVLASRLQGISSFDPWTYGTVACLLGLATLLASIFPALQAARIDPAAALRQN